MMADSGDPQVLKQLKQAEDEVYARTLRVRPIRTVAFASEQPEGLSALAFPGVVTVWFAPSGGTLLDRIHDAYAEHGGKDPALEAEVLDQGQGLEEMPLGDAVALLKKQPVFASIRYAGNTLAPHLFVPPGKQVGAITFPYNGGALADPGFELAEHLVDDTDAGMDALAIAWAPKTSPVEAAALRAVPDDQRELNVARSDDCEWTTVAYAVTATLVVAAVTVQVVTATTVGLAVGMAAEGMTDDDVKAAGPHASARDLLKRRREILRRARER